MIVDEVGDYKLIEKVRVRNTRSVGVLNIGEVIHISNIDRANEKVTGPCLVDWINWNLPVHPLKREDDEIN